MSSKLKEIVRAGEEHSHTDGHMKIEYDVSFGPKGEAITYHTLFQVSKETYKQMNLFYNNVAAKMQIPKAQLNRRIFVIGLNELAKNEEIEITPQYKMAIAAARIEADKDYHKNMLAVYQSLGNEDDFIDWCDKNSIPEIDAKDFLSNMLNVAGIQTETDKITMFLTDTLLSGPKHIDEIKERAKECDITSSWNMIKKVASELGYSSNDDRRGYWKRES